MCLCLWWVMVWDKRTLGIRSGVEVLQQLRRCVSCMRGKNELNLKRFFFLSLQSSYYYFTKKSKSKSINLEDVTCNPC